MKKHNLEIAASYHESDWNGELGFIIFAGCLVQHEVAGCCSYRAFSLEKGIMLESQSADLCILVKNLKSSLKRWEP